MAGAADAWCIAAGSPDLVATPNAASVREMCARMVVTGASNRDVASALHISDHTVRAHISRTLAAFGVATRSGLPAAMHQASAAPGTTRPVLTPRQREVVALVAAGLPNDEIAVRLGLSQRTVERHVSDVLVRWSQPNRTALARAWHQQAD